MLGRISPFCACAALGALALGGCGPAEELDEQLETAQEGALGCGELVVGGIGYPVGNRSTHPAGGWQVWQVLAHHWPAWGGRHLAQDVSLPGGVGAINAPVYSMANGVVLYAKANGSTYRNVILIRHDLQDGGHVCSFYGHVNTPMVSAGQSVSRGQPIATVMDWAVAAGGASSNTHLHYVLLDEAYCAFAASTGTANWSGSGVCGYDHGGANGVGWSDLSTEPARYTAVNDSCGAWQFQDGLLSPSKFVQAQQAAAAQCSGGGGSADVTVLDLWWTPENPAPGDTVDFFAKVQNLGAATTADIVGVGFKLDGIQHGNWWDTVGPMAPGQVHDFHMQASWSAGPAGSYQITAHADDIDRFAESDENNNVRIETLAIATGGFPCDPAKSNCCHYAPQTPAVPETFPGELCDPNGDGSYADADWTGGWYCYQAACSP